jgi:hypothetical protein
MNVIQDYVSCDDFGFFLFVWQIPTFVQSVEYVHLCQDPWSEIYDLLWIVGSLIPKSSNCLLQIKESE